MIVEKYYRTLGGTLLAAGIILAGLLNVSTRAEAQSARPNIVVMMADNLGYGDVGAYGGSRAPTPRIDALAREGIQLADFQVEPNCTP
ncbi:MAG: sulfatase-like hydrolase/transferase, partial [Gammaproteobacteria bacterium]|nr:sulfatase-like hydrolase/transferase [Gammaproteobacteria bacterium]